MPGGSFILTTAAVEMDPPPERIGKNKIKSRRRREAAQPEVPEVLQDLPPPSGPSAAALAAAKRKSKALGLAMDQRPTGGPTTDWASYRGTPAVGSPREPGAPPPLKQRHAAALPRAAKAAKEAALRQKEAAAVAAGGEVPNIKRPPPPELQGTVLEEAGKAAEGKLSGGKAAASESSGSRPSGSPTLPDGSLDLQKFGLPPCSKCGRFCICGRK